MQQRNDAQNQLAAEQSTTRGETHPSSNIDPASGVADDSGKAWPTDDCGPMILTASCWIRRKEFSKRRGETEIAETGHYKTPQDCTCASRRKCKRQGCGEGGPTVENSKGQAKHGDSAEVSLKFWLHS